MEVLQADDRLREEIIADARKKADRIVKKAEKEAADIGKKVEKDLKLFEESFAAGVEETVSSEKRLLFSSIEIEVRKKNLLFIGEHIDKLFQTVKERIKNDAGYLELIKKLLIKGAETLKSEHYIIEIGRLEKVGEEDLAGLALGEGKVKAVTQGSFRRGFKLFTENKKLFTFVSLDKFIEDLKSTKRNEVYKAVSGK